MKTLTTKHKSVNDQLKEIITPSGKSYYEVQRAKARNIAIVLTISTIFFMVFLLFAIVQKSAADTAREMAVQNERLAHEQAKRHQEVASQLEAELAKCKAGLTDQ